MERSEQHRPSMIYHVVSESDFRSQLVGSTYVPANIITDGFVHCSLEASVIPVANDYYAAVVDNLVLLKIDPNRLTSETRYEEAAPIAGGGTSHLTSSPRFHMSMGRSGIAAITGVGLLGKTASGYAWPVTLCRSRRSWPPAIGPAQDMKPESASAALLIPRLTADTGANL